MNYIVVLSFLHVCFIDFIIPNEHDFSRFLCEGFEFKRYFHSKAPQHWRWCNEDLGQVLRAGSQLRTVTFSDLGSASDLPCLSLRMTSYQHHGSARSGGGHGEGLTPGPRAEEQHRAVDL